jgi:hypothetical protein
MPFKILHSLARLLMLPRLGNSKFYEGFPVLHFLFVITVGEDNEWKRLLACSSRRDLQEYLERVRNLHRATSTLLELRWLQDTETFLTFLILRFKLQHYQVKGFFGAVEGALLPQNCILTAAHCVEDKGLFHIQIDPFGTRRADSDFALLRLHRWFCADCRLRADWIG